MNREELDMIVKQALFAYSNSLLVEIGRELTPPVHEDSFKWAHGRIREREDALSLFRNDAKRAAVVDALLKEMNS